MKIPFEPSLFGLNIPLHLVFEYLAFLIAFRYYVYLRKRSKDIISNSNRLSIILGAALGALIGSRLIGILENPYALSETPSFIKLLNSKTIMGGLFGGLLGVELTKKIIKESSSSGDLFTFPIIIGILIGRIGCFFSGINEFTYGKETSFFLGMDLGDGINRHPLALYEIAFLLLLFAFLKIIKKSCSLENGTVFKYFMVLYFGFRFLIEFLKPNTFFVIGLSTIQWLCVVCFVYYWRTVINVLRYAR